MVLAAHADQAWRCSAIPARRSSACLEPGATTAIRTVLHTDTGILPPRRRLWASGTIFAR